MFKNSVGHPLIAYIEASPASSIAIAHCNVAYIKQQAHLRPQAVFRLQGLYDRSQRWRACINNLSLKTFFAEGSIQQYNREALLQVHLKAPLPQLACDGLPSPVVSVWK